MPKTPCKALRKDGQPCQGLGQEQYDGYCIAHAPADKVWEWRSRGGQASSTAARADKRVPDRIRGAIEKVTKGMDDLIAGEIEPAALSAITRAARVLIDLHHVADAEMDLIREEEAAVAASQVAGSIGDPDLLDKADAIAAWQNNYRIESLILQGLVTIDTPKGGTDALPAQPVLTDAGRRRFGLQRLTGYTQADFDDLKDRIMDTSLDEVDLLAVRGRLSRMRNALEEAGRDLAHDPGPVRDPLTGQVLSEPPPGVIVGTLPDVDVGEDEDVAKVLQDQLRQVSDLNRQLEQIYFDEIREAELRGWQEPPALPDVLAALRALNGETRPL